MEKYGFVYIWYDRKHNRYYIGCRWGTEDDGYICSSVWMKNSYKRRPQDFKRRVLKRNIDKEDLLTEEFKWLNMIKDDELGEKYYNLSKHHFGHWHTEKNCTAIKQKISENSKGRVWYHDPITNKNYTFKQNSTVTPGLVKGRSPDYNKRLSQAKAGQKFSDQGYKNIIENLGKATERMKELHKNEKFSKSRGMKISKAKKQPITLDGIYYTSRTDAKKKLGKKQYFMRTKI